MAIDDNTVYGLTGAQVKELPEKIEAVKGKAKVLTTADYNWPTANPDGVALWLLESGTYVGPEGEAVRVYMQAYTSSYMGAAFPNMAIVLKSVFDSNQRGGFLWISMGNGTVVSYYGINLSGTSGSNKTLLTRLDIVNDLTSTLTTSVLSANQGRVLKDLIDVISQSGAGAPTTSTIGTVGQLYQDTTNGDLYQLKSINTTVTPNEYNWEIVGGSSVNVVQTTGTSTTDVMSQNAVTNALANKADASAIPTVNNAVLTIQNNGTSVGEFAANASSNVTANIPAATTSTYGVTQLSISTSSTASNVAATPSAVKSAYDLADSKATITVTDADPGEGSPLAANNYIAVYGGTPFNDNYSTTEINTGTTWIDGSPIYKKTIDTGALPNATSKNVAHSVSNLLRVIKIEGYAYRPSDATNQFLPLVAGAIGDQVSVVVTSTDVRLSCANDRSNYTESYITLYYTKSS